MSPRFAKAALLALAAAALSIGTMYSFAVQAGQPNQSATQQTTPEATPQAPLAGSTVTPSGPSNVLFPPCPADATPAATSAATAAGESATPAATQQTTTTPASATLGVTPWQVENCGVRVIEVFDGSPAAQAKLQIDDVIVAVNGTPTASVEDLNRLVGDVSAGNKVELTIQRQGQQMNLPVTLGLRPPQEASPEATAPSLSTLVAPTATP